MKVTIPQPVISNFAASYNGGSINISGSGLSPSATLNVNGFKGKLQNITPNDAIASIPAFVSSLSQNQYDLSSPQKLTSNQYSVISDTQIGNSNAFDSLMGTIYSSSSNSTCFIGIDVGS